MSAWLKLRLQAGDPDTPFEVVNCGGVSYASYRVSRILDEVLTHQPDAIVIYTGHNEFLEEREYGPDLAWNRHWIDRVATKFRTVTWLKSKLQPASPSRPVMSSEVDARLDRIGGLERYHRDPEWRGGVEQHFAIALERMVMTVRRAGVPLVMCVPASDLVDTPPFKVENRWPADTSQREAFDQQWAIATAEGPPAERLAALQQCLKLDPQHAGAHYGAGLLYYQRGDQQAARTHLTAARDFDVCPLRATSPIVRSVIDIADRYQVPIVRSDQLLDRRDVDGSARPDGICDPGYFVDHVHPTVAGHQAIAAEIARHLQRLEFFAVDDGAEERYRSLARTHLAGLGEDYYARGNQRLEGLRRWASGRAGKLVPTP